MREPVLAEAPAPASGAMRLALVLAAIATIYLGVMPGRVLKYSEAGARDLYPAAAAAGSATPESSTHGSSTFPGPVATTPVK
jgi:hypothetical protein